ncbi:hypothetical protein BDQ12DRAFT_673467 [Crucibulum laeve]|uniref:Uncharacterized protein n=1 Tax=Crucibulum laeve TaxID=68775 RepID=A0A5C3MJ39_9AGAR|nr:hypothetical protein BDQ12DRAFT_673467 [Crucibulum laeve]
MSAQSLSSRRSSAETSHHISRTHSLPSNSTTNSLSLHHRSVIPRIVVQTPMWLPAYPNGQNDATSTTLSPLSENDVPLRGITSPNTSTQRQLSSRGVQSMTPRMSNPKTISQSQTAESKNSSGCFDGQPSPLSCSHCRKEDVYASHSPLPTSHVVHNPSSDPRSPFTSKGMAPMTAK